MLWLEITRSWCLKVRWANTVIQIILKEEVISQTLTTLSRWLPQEESVAEEQHLGNEMMAHPMFCYSRDHTAMNRQQLAALSSSAMEALWSPETLILHLSWTRKAMLRFIITPQTSKPSKHSIIRSCWTLICSVRRGLCWIRASSGMEDQLMLTMRRTAGPIKRYKTVR